MMVGNALAAFVFALFLLLGDESVLYAQIPCSGKLGDIHLGVEVGNLQNGGVDWYAEIRKSIYLEELQVHLSYGFPLGGDVSGQILAIGWITRTKPTFQPGPAYPPESKSGPIGATRVFNPNGYIASGNYGIFASLYPALFIINQKANAPSPVNSDVTGYAGYEVPAGSFLVVHIDGLGPVADVEVRGHVLYRECP